MKLKQFRMSVVTGLIGDPVVTKKSRKSIIKVYSMNSRKRMISGTSKRFSKAAHIPPAIDKKLLCRLCSIKAKPEKNNSHRR